jgi:hypothetical protein
MMMTDTPKARFFYLCNCSKLQVDSVYRVTATPLCQDVSPETLKNIQLTNHFTAEHDITEKI